MAGFTAPQTLHGFTPTPRAQKAMARFLGSAGFTENGLPIGNH